MGQWCRLKEKFLFLAGWSEKTSPRPPEKGGKMEKKRGEEYGQLCYVVQRGAVLWKNQREESVNHNAERRKSADCGLKHEPYMA